jgi:two-component system sensor histidine kinase UhpB
MNGSVSTTVTPGASEAQQCEHSGHPLRRRPSMRSQVLGTVLLINMVAALIAGLGIIWNARTQTDREMAATVELTERLVRDSVERFGAEAQDQKFEALAVQGRSQRHVRIRFEHGDGRIIDVVSPGPGGEAGAPGWFAALVGAREIEREIPIVTQGKPAGRVVITGTPSDEVAEVWEDVKDFLVIAIGVNLAILLALYFALGRVLAQLRYVAEGLGELEQGRFGHRMVPPEGRELAALTERFNALAGALAAARQDNARLNRELVSTQDDERRQIAADLHDELGPCLFGLKANAGSLERLVSEAAPAAATKMQERIASIVEIVERMQVLNRRLLQKLRPVAIDHVPLADVLANLVAEFERHAPEQHFDLDLGLLAPRYGDSIDVTLYRCIQEGVTNALKHGDAREVRITVREVTNAEGRSLALRIEDDGHGLPAEPALGMGLIGMGERVRALGGHCKIAAAADKGAYVAVDIPIAPEPHDAKIPHQDKRGPS